MQTWKKPLAIAIASAGVIVGLSGSPMAHDQSTETPKIVQAGNQKTSNAPASNGVPVHSLSSASLDIGQEYTEPTEINSISQTPQSWETATPQATLEADITPYNNALGSADENPTNEAFTDFAPTNEALTGDGIANQAVPNEFPTNEIAKDENANNDFPTTGFAAPQETATQPVRDANANTSQPGMPTMIIHPAVDGLDSINDLTVNIEKIPSASGSNEFAVRLRVPSSVKIIEVTPIGGQPTSQTFKIQLDQSSSATAGSDYSTPTTTPVRAASSLNTYGSRHQTNPHNSMPTLRTQPPARGGFKKNPFFDSNQTSNLPPRAAQIAVDSPRETNGIYQADAVPTKASADTTSIQTSFQLDSNSDSPQPPPAPFHSEPAHPATEIHSSLYGPDVMGIGDVGQFAINIRNPTSRPLNNVIVSLDVPAGLELIPSHITQAAMRNGRKLTWQIHSLAPGQEHFIRYRSKSTTEGIQQQHVWICHTESTGIAVSLKTNVNAEFQVSEAPLLKFEPTPAQ